MASFDSMGKAWCNRWGKAPMNSVNRIRMFNKFDSDQLWVALIIGLVMLILAIYRMLAL